MLTECISFPFHEGSNKIQILGFVKLKITISFKRTAGLKLKFLLNTERARLVKNSILLKASFVCENLKSYKEDYIEDFVPRHYVGIAYKFRGKYKGATDYVLFIKIK